MSILPYCAGELFRYTGNKDVMVSPWSLDYE